jgi:peroxiredoxin
MALLHTPAAIHGAAAPDFVLPGTDGRMHSRDGCRGPAGLLVMFICNHCPYVQAIRERLVGDARELIAAGVGVVAISSNDACDYPEDGPEAMREIALNLGFPFPYLHDASQAVARAYGAVCTPDFFGYDAQLQLRFRGRLDAAHRGPRPQGMRRELVEAMLEVASGSDSMVPQVPSMGCSIKWIRDAG